MRLVFFVCDFCKKDIQNHKIAHGMEMPKFVLRNIFAGNELCDTCASLAFKSLHRVCKKLGK